MVLRQDELFDHYSQFHFIFRINSNEIRKQEGCMFPLDTFNFLYQLAYSRKCRF